MKTQNLLSLSDEQNLVLNTSSLAASVNQLNERLTEPMTALLKGARILLVEDSEDNMRLFTRILEASGAEVETAINGVEAIRQIVRPEMGKYDAIIMDIQMPQLDGNQATKVIRSFGYLGPIIALTANSSLEMKEYSLKCGCSHFYQKPISRMELVKAVSRALPQDTVAISG